RLMKSIRLSLVMYVLVLLAVALGSVSVLAYQSTQRILETKEAIRRELLSQRYEADCRREFEKLDDLLFQQATALAGQSSLHLGGLTGSHTYLSLAVLGAALDSNYLLWEYAFRPYPRRGFWAAPVTRMFMRQSKIEIREELLPHDPLVTEYFQ